MMVGFGICFYAMGCCVLTGFVSVRRQKFKPSGTCGAQNLMVFAPRLAIQTDINVVHSIRT
ncbi:hypothetical protein BDZ94DRAFT_1256694 [Collybia nuda]|uniref:Uncharacterized protein n=1 Tax=Collybia nuda TaxID=64659 RepID=A0A9P5Y8U3_9AGAR|nr:hypothetical protein BDZ94DRAFT_1256694 [Collybia nuda]